MNRQRGQLLAYGALAAGAVILVMGIALKVQGSRLQSCKDEYAAFVANVKAQGELAKAQAIKKEAQDAKQIQDAVSQRDLALKRLRQSANTPSRNLPLVPAAAKGSDTICFGAKALNAAVERYRGDVRQLAESGDEAQLDAVTLIQAWPLKMAQEIKP